jgi:hypothetical protein
MRTAVKLAGLLLLCVAAAVALLVFNNAAPEVPALSDADAADAARPYVIKLHARWCPVCMVTRDEWAVVEGEYAGKVRLVVFDFTSDATTATSRQQAARLGLEEVFDEFVGETGTILVLDGRTKEIRHVLHGSRDEADYRAAIDDVLAAPPPG